MKAGYGGLQELREQFWWVEGGGFVRDPKGISHQRKRRGIQFLSRVVNFEKSTMTTSSNRDHFFQTS